MSDINYNEILADLIAKRDKLNAAIAGVEAMLEMNMHELTGESAASPYGIPKPDLGPGAFLGMPVLDAAIKLLHERRQQHRTEDIVGELKRGGIEFTSENPIHTVSSILNRNWSAGGEVVRVARGVWGLAEWHPELRRKPAGAKNGANGADTKDSADAEIAPDSQV